MSDNQQPREYDVVLGGQSPSLEGAAVLGGIEGVRMRLSNPDPQVRIAGIWQALNYGEQGLDLVIQALNDESFNVQDAAYFLLKSRTETKVKQPLIESEVYLIKQRGSIDYTDLRDFLAAGEWKEADHKTAELMGTVERQKKGLQKYDWIPHDLENFPCEDLHIIDQLWMKYSNGRFGFSAQKGIYQSLGGTQEQKLEAFVEAVSWSKRGELLEDYSDNTFDIKAPKGNLPFAAFRQWFIQIDTGWQWQMMNSKVFMPQRASILASRFAKFNI